MIFPPQSQCAQIRIHASLIFKILPLAVPFFMNMDRRAVRNYIQKYTFRELWQKKRKKKQGLKLLMVRSSRSELHELPPFSSFTETTHISLIQ
jgi:hypothetical protein